SLGGIDKIAETKFLLEKIIISFNKDVLEYPGCEITAISTLFIYDADARGVQETIRLWNERYFHFSFDLEISQNHSRWIDIKDHRIGIFVFTGPDGNQGTLEDNLIEIFRSNSGTLLGDAENLLDQYFHGKSENEDELVYLTKKKKGILTICGQTEKKNAGYALSVVVRDTELLNNTFYPINQNTQWAILLNFINNSFL
ncbi:MAG: hypothetical protein HQL94_05075, partial [Magnetococcales bacterium]|nr:hypothetical protein [Magnetococcales bacterium]